MPRYEKRTPKGVDFIDVRIRDKTIQAGSGRVGAKPAQKTTKHASRRMAEARFRVAIKSARSKGYEHVSTCHTVVDNPALERAIRERPDDDAVRVVYGDWLQEQGDPRGQLIAVQQALRSARGSNVMSLGKRERALLAEHSSIWYGTLDEILHEQSYSQRPHVRAVWRLGFLDEVEARHTEGDARFPCGEFGVPDRVKLSEIVQTLSELHSARFVTRLILGGMAADYEPSLRVLATGWPTTLRSLTITGTLGGESTPVPHRLGSLAALCKAHPQLEQLSLRLEQERPGRLELPKLQQLALWANRLSKEQLRDVARGAWPVLRSFELDINQVALADLKPLFTSKLFPALETLRLGWLREADHASAVAAVLRNSTLFEQLREVVITGPMWGDWQASVLPVVTKALAGTHVAVTTDARET